MKSKKLMPFMIIIILFLVLPMVIFAQGPPDPEDTPIDGGLSLLLAAGAAYGVKKYRDSKKKAAHDEEPLK